MTDIGPPAATTKCPKCGSDNPSTNLFCGQCGGGLDASQAALAEAIRSVLKQELRDRKVIEVETAQNIVTRLTHWAKLFGLFAAVPLTLLLAILAILGVSKFADVNDKLKSAGDKAAALQVTSAELDQKYTQLKNDASRYETLKEEVDADSARVSALENDVRLKVEQASQNSQDIKDTSAQVIAMRKQVADLTTKIQSAQQLETGTQFGLTSLSSAVFLSSSGQPAILTGPLSFSSSFSLAGSNFGATKGSVYVRVSRQGDLAAYLNSLSDMDIKIDDASIIDWQDQVVRLSLTDEDMKKVNDARATSRSVALGSSSVMALESTTIFVLIQTSSGDKSNWYLLATF